MWTSLKRLTFSIGHLLFIKTMFMSRQNINVSNVLDARPRALKIICDRLQKSIIFYLKASTTKATQIVISVSILPFKESRLIGYIKANIIPTVCGIITDTVFLGTRVARRSEFLHLPNFNIHLHRGQIRPLPRSRSTASRASGLEPNR